MNTIINGKEIAKNVIKEVKNDLVLLNTMYNKLPIPKLAIVRVDTGNEGHDKASKTYIGRKVDAAKKCGIETVLHELEFKTTDTKLIRLIKKLNKDKSIHGIIVQLPLPAHINEFAVNEVISKDKDVDGFTTENIGLNVLGDTKNSLVSCTPAGVMRMISETCEDVKGKNVVVVGRSNIVGKPLVNLLINAGATVTCCNSSTKQLKKITKSADIVITAVGKAKMFNQKYFKNNQIIIDVGINFDKHGKMCGDVDFDAVMRNLKGMKVTPVPGGVGPMTVAMLMSNVKKSYVKLVDINEGTTEG